MPVCATTAHTLRRLTLTAAVAPPPSPPSPQHIGPFSLFTLHNFKVSVPTRLGCRQIAALTTLPKNKLVCPINIGASMEIEMNNRQPYQLTKSKSWKLFWSYLQNCTANTAHLPQKYATNGPNGLNWQYSFAGSSKTAPGI